MPLQPLIEKRVASTTLGKVGRPGPCTLAWLVAAQNAVFTTDHGEVTITFRSFAPARQMLIKIDQV